MPLRGLIFDVGDILYDATAWRRWLAVELSQRGCAVTYPELVVAWEALLVDVYRGQANYWDRFRDLLSRFGLPLESHTDFEALARDKGQAVQVDRSPMPNVPATLDGLRARGIQLAALSDTESGETGLRKLLKQLQLEARMDAVVSSFEIGHAKPEPEAYQHALNALKLNKDDCAFVGHDIDELEGAQAFGLTAIAYNYADQAPADVYIDDFSELLTAVAE